MDTHLKHQFVALAARFVIASTVGVPLLVASPVVSGAQVPGILDPRFTPFRIPSTPVKCEVRAGTPDDPVASPLILSYEDGAELVDERLMDFGYEASGRPVWISVIADESKSEGGGTVQATQKWSVITHGFLVTFDATGKAFGFHVPGLRPGELGSFPGIP
jgi:hypothetical protein